MGLLSPTVTTASAAQPSVASSATTARSVAAPVNSPTQGAGTDARRANAAIIPEVSRHGSFFPTWTLRRARASAKPPRCTAEDRTRRGCELTTTTASLPISMDTPAITPRLLERRPQPDERVDAEGREAAHLGVLLVEQVLHSGRQLDLLE